MVKNKYNNFSYARFILSLNWYKNVKLIVTLRKILTFQLLNQMYESNNQNFKNSSTKIPFPPNYLSSEGINVIKDEILLTEEGLTEE